MSENEVSLVISGDASSLDKAIADATKQVQSMDDTIGTAAGHAQDAAPHFGGVADKADAVGEKSAKAFGAVGALGSGLQLAGLGGSGFATALGGVGLGFDALSGIGDTITLISGFGKGAEEAGKAVDGATKAQRGLNLSMLANPIVLIVAAIVALIAIIVIIATKTDWFQRIWHAAWGGIKAAAKAVGDWFSHTLWPGIKSVYDHLRDGIDAVVSFFHGVPGKIAKAFGGLARLITSPFRDAFNFIADAWNDTIGRLSFRVPSWVPGIGGKGFDVPDIPHFHSGGVVPGPPGAETLAVLQSGETVTPAGRGTPQSVVVSAGDAVTATLIAAIRDDIASRFGGDVTIYLAGAR